MRKILFRGKDVETGEWRMGSYYFGSMYYELLDDKKYYIADDNASLYYEVIPETVGQYTGIDDKNGSKIFKGDIISFSGCDYDGEEYMRYKATGFVEFANGAFCIKDDDMWYEANFFEDCEVVGNIHDNPELLEV
jgi:uncharacterized phage protein (TIGR01671 family)